MATRIEARTKEDGTTEVTQRPLTAEEQRRLDGMISVEIKPEQPLTPAQERIKRIKAQRGSLVVTQSIAGEDWHILKMDLPKSTTAAHYAASLCNGHSFDLKEPAVMAAMMVAMLRHGVVNSPDDLTPYFDSEAIAREYVTEPGAMGLGCELFALITEANPHLIPLLQGAMNRSSTPAGS